MKQVNVYIETYGCQMNKLDSETAAAILTAGGHTVVDDMGDADVILLNTCAVRDNAEQRIHGRIGQLQSLKSGNPRLQFGIIGCMAQRLGGRLNGTVEIVAGPDTYRRLPDMVSRAAMSRVIDTTLAPEELYDGIEPARIDDCSAWVAITRGCNNFCTYCVVPYTRGRERSVAAVEVLSTVKGLAERGYREVTLLGQNVNSYRDGDTDFAWLLKRTAETGIPWVRFLTSHPKDLDAVILGVMRDCPAVCRHLHLPLQSGSDRILEAMNRRYTVARYREFVDSARSMVDGINLSTDIIFGFPGETEEDYEATIRMMEDIRFDFAFLYRYSEREGTAACALPGAVPEGVRIERLERAIELQNAIMRKKNMEHIGRKAVVLVKGPSKDGAGWYGFTETNIPVVISSGGVEVKKGDFVNVRIEATTGASLLGTIT